MKIYYQGEAGAYSHISSLEITKAMNLNKNDIIGLSDFSLVWKSIDLTSIGVLPIENSYAGSIHENLYNFLRYDHKIIGEYNLEVKHCLLSLENDIKKINKVYSHHQALSQCYEFLKENDLEAVKFYDTAGSAKYISENKQVGVGAIASSLAGEIYNLNNLKQNIADQKGNTTRFFIIADKNSSLVYEKKSNKISIIFETKDESSILYKCLSVFATNSINLKKIESIPSYKDPFTYSFWLDFEGKLSDKNIIKALSELKDFTRDIKILGEY